MVVDSMVEAVRTILMDKLHTAGIMSHVDLTQMVRETCGNEPWYDEQMIAMVMVKMTMSKEVRVKTISGEIVYSMIVD